MTTEPPVAPPAPAASTGSGVSLVWLPVGAGQPVVRFSGRCDEQLHAWRDRRPPRELYHAALEVTTPQLRFAVELAPVPDRNGHTRGGVGEGPVVRRHPIEDAGVPFREDEMVPR